MSEMASLIPAGLGLLWQLPPIIFIFATLVALFAVIREHRHGLDHREPETRDRG